MKILWLCPFFPYPTNSGIRIREYNLIRELSKWHDITLISLIQSEEEKNFAAALNPFCNSVYAVRPQNQLPSALDTKRNGLLALKGIIQKEPQNFYGPPSPNIIDTIRSLIKNNDPDALIVDTLFMTNYIWDILSEIKASTVLVEHNIEYFIQKQQWQKASGLKNKLRKRIYYSSFEGFERAACRRFQKIITVSEVDTEKLKQLDPDIDLQKVCVVPNGVDSKLLIPSTLPYEPYTLIYNGALTYEANYDAVKFFLAEIFPLICAQKPDVRFLITGSIKGVDTNQLKTRENVIFTGYLDQVHTTIQKSATCVVPLQWGGGTRLKILEAMSLGTPVVSTIVGVEGLDLQWGREILVSDDPPVFAAHVLRLLNDPDLRTRIAQSARLAVEKLYDWESIAQTFHDFLMKQIPIQ